MKLKHPVAGHIILIEQENIFPNPNQPRLRFDFDELTSLAESIRHNGLLQPLTVRRTENENYFELVAGERRLLAARMVRVRLLGDLSYTFTPELRDTYASTRQQIEGSSLKGVSAMLAELDRLGVSGYGLWDLNAARWQRLYGFEPRTEVRTLGREAAEETISLNNDFEMLAREDNGQAVRRLQELLIDTGYMQGRADGSFGDGTDRAVRAARRYWGMMECGIADRAFIDALTSGATVQAEPPETDALTPLGRVCALLD